MTRKELIEKTLETAKDWTLRLSVYKVIYKPPPGNGCSPEWLDKVAVFAAHDANVLTCADDAQTVNIPNYYRQNLIMRGKTIILDKNMSNWRHLLVLFMTLEEVYGEYKP